MPVPFPLGLTRADLLRPATDITPAVVSGVGMDGGGTVALQSAAVSDALATWATEGAARTTAVASAPARRALVVLWVEHRAFSACAVDMETNPERWQAPEGEGGHQWNLAVQLKAMRARADAKRAAFDADLAAALPIVPPAPVRGTGTATGAVCNVYTF